MEDDVSAFLDTCGWSDVSQTAIVGDASSRQYRRLSKSNGSTAVLMIDRAGAQVSIQRFLAISDALRAVGLSAPCTLAANTEKGLILLEDLGDLRVSDGLAAGLWQEETLYSAAIDTLFSLQRASPAIGLSAPSASEQARMTDLAFSWYSEGADTPATSKTEAFFEALETALAEIAPKDPVPAHRDFHAENLFWLPTRIGIARIGIIDFQDMFLGHPLYDLVSLLTDARRDISSDLRRQMTGYFCDASGWATSDAERAFAVISVQRNTRILGVFARLAIRDHKRHYLDLIPRVWGYLVEAINHPDLEDLAHKFKDTLPAPDQDHLQRLRAAC